jgi:hypothetical protein
MGRKRNSVESIRDHSSRPSTEEKAAVSKRALGYSLFATAVTAAEAL